ncbi:MAG: hypothetical protein J0M10_14455 [Chitinophagales bacterium]|nr:hypothetical protein [Chitinophagales bacterium]
MSKTKLKILFVCTINRMRSITAETIFSDDERFETRSAGTDKSASICLDETLLDWADTVLVMEKHHRATIRTRFPRHYEAKRIVCLYIPDDYEFMQPELISILKHRVEDVYEKGLIGRSR